MNGKMKRFLQPLFIRVACEMIAVGSGQFTVSSTFLLTKVLQEEEVAQLTL